MKINKIALTNFKGIEFAELNLQEQCTVFYGINGVGKTTILRAIDLLYSSIINRIVQGRFKQGIQIELSDIKFEKSNCKISCDFILDGENTVEYYRGMQRKKKEP